MASQDTTRTSAVVIEKEVKRRADMVGIFPDEKSILHLIGAVLLEQNDAWQRQHRSMQREAMADLLQPSTADDPLRRSTPGRLSDGHPKRHPNLPPVDGRDHQNPDPAETRCRHPPDCSGYSRRSPACESPALPVANSA
jgi:hypothetical protein